MLKKKTTPNNDKYMSMLRLKEEMQEELNKVLWELFDHEASIRELEAELPKHI